MKKNKPAIERLEDFEPYKEYLKRKIVVDQFLEVMESTLMRQFSSIPKENITALLLIFMEWQEKLMKKLDETPE